MTVRIPYEEMKVQNGGRVAWNVGNADIEMNFTISYYTRKHLHIWQESLLKLQTCVSK